MLDSSLFVSIVEIAMLFSGTVKGVESVVPTNTPIMTAIRFHEYGGFEVLKYEDVLRPEPQPGEVLIQVRAASVNPFDLALREGWLASMIPLQLPAIVGVDVAGIVMATGEGVTDFGIGQNVYGFMGGYSGAYAQYAAVSCETISPHPQTLDYVQAASVPLATRVLPSWPSCRRKPMSMPI